MIKSSEEMDLKHQFKAFLARMKTAVIPED